MKKIITSLYLTLFTIGLSAQHFDCSKAIISQAINGEILNQISFNFDEKIIEYRMGSEESYSLYKDTLDFSFLVDSNNISQLRLIVGTSMRRENEKTEFYCDFGPRDDMHLLFEFLANTPDENNNKVLGTASFSIPTVCNSQSSKELMLRLWNEYDRIKNKVIENKR